MHNAHSTNIVSHEKKHHLDGTADGLEIRQSPAEVGSLLPITNRVLAPSKPVVIHRRISGSQESMAKSRRSFLAAKSAAASCVFNRFFPRWTVNA